MKPCGINRRAVSQEVLINLISCICSASQAYLSDYIPFVYVCTVDLIHVTLNGFGSIKSALVVLKQKYSRLAMSKPSMPLH